MKKHALLKRLFHGVPVVDAKRELRVFVLPEDIEHAQRNNPIECVFAQACRRLFGSHRVAFFHSVAYAELPLPAGGTRIERFMLPKMTRDSILVWDRAGVADPGGYLLTPPRAGQTLDYKLAYRRDNPVPQKVRKTPALRADFRSGSGLVKFLGEGPKDWSARSNTQARAHGP